METQFFFSRSFTGSGKRVESEEKIRNFCFPSTFLSFFVTALEGEETLEVNLGAGDAFFLEVVES